MKIERVYAVILRYILVVPRDLYRVFELIFYPIMDIVLWGFMGLWVQQQTQRDFNFGILLPASLVLWMVVERTQSEISLNLAEEIWAHNIINLFVTPMKLIDWLTSVIILGIVKALFIFFFATLTLWVFLGVNILSLGMILVPLWILLLLSGFVIGMCVTALLMRYGRHLSPLIWSIPYLILSFSAVFYPVSMLPRWAQYIARILPTTYVFETLRTFVMQKVIDYKMLTYGFSLTFFYLIIASFLIVWLFSKSREIGLSQLESD